MTGLTSTYVVVLARKSARKNAFFSLELVKHASFRGIDFIALFKLNALFRLTFDNICSDFLKSLITFEVNGCWLHCNPFTIKNVNGMYEPFLLLLEWYHVYTPGFFQIRVCVSFVS